MRHLPRNAVAAITASAALALLTACGSSSGTTVTPAAGASSSGSVQGSSTAIPTQDVVSSIQADPALRAELPAAVRSSGSLALGSVKVVGTSGLPHGGQTPDGKVVGLDVDLRDAVAKVLGISWNVQYGTFPTIIPGVQNGKYDVGMSNFGATKAREKVVDFTTYLKDGQSFLGAAGLKIDSASTITDLCGYNVATSPGTTFQQLLTDGASKCAAAGKSPYKVQYFADTAPIFLGLANGKIDIEFGPTLALKYDAAHIPGTKYLGQVGTTPVGFVTAKGSPLAKVLSDAVNKLIATGDYAKIFAKWGVPDTGVTSSVVNPPTTF
ncbi:transporter substrate-binding domain-containing protein [Streptacidiphilus sp. EB103A]|uniref:transporter substrate-binding domain-containing protein n=1 Tax=Streptacidiphilus sp. EB103A TaxID=3156275 RepID=UPI003511C4EA